MNKTKTILLTQEGLDKLQVELANLKDVVMREIAAKIKEAKEFGDLSENAEYIEAKEFQAATAMRIMEIEDMLKHVEIIDESKAAKSKTVQIGSHVVVEAMDDEESVKEEYIIVGSTEADPFVGKISNESPLGNALIDKPEGAVIEFKAPKGPRKYKLVKVS